MNPVFICIAAAWILLMVVMWRGVGVKQIFNFPIYYIFLGADIGGHKKGFKLSRYNIFGIPDAVFFDPLHFRFVIGEYKSREYRKSNRVHWREMYQVTLYGGLVNRFFLRKPRIVICYGCGHTEEVNYNKKIFKQLLKLKSELHYAKTKWRAQNPTALQYRRG